MAGNLFWLIVSVVLICAPSSVSAVPGTADSSLAAIRKQGKDDTFKVNRLLDLSRAYYLSHRHDSSSLTYAQTALDLASQLQFKRGQTIAWRHMGNCYTDLNDSTKALACYRKSIALCKQMKDDEGIARNLLNIGMLYKNVLDFEQSDRYLSQALAKVGMLKDQHLLPSVYVEYGHLYYQRLNLSKALEYYHKALDYSERWGNNAGKIDVLKRIGEVYYHLNDFGKTLDCIEKIKTINLINDDRRGLAFTYSWKGNVLMNTGQYEASLQAYSQSIKISNAINDEVSLAEDYANVAVIYQTLSDFKQALQYHQQCKLLADKHNNQFLRMLYFKDMGMLIQNAPDSILSDLRIDPSRRFQTSIDYETHALNLAFALGDVPQKTYIWSLLINAYQESGNYKEAYTTLLNYIAVRDSMAGQDAKAEIARKEAHYAFEKERLITKAEHEKDQMRLAIAVAVILILAFIGYALYYITRLRKNKEYQLYVAQQQVAQLEKERAEAELLKAQADIQLFLKNIHDKNLIIETISEELKELKNAPHPVAFDLNHSLSALREKSILTNDDWLEFLNSFNKLYPDFTIIIKEQYPSITASELRYLMLSKLGLAHKEMAQILGVTSDSVRVTWNRTRNKLQGNLDDTPYSLLAKMGINN